MMRRAILLLAVAIAIGEDPCRFIQPDKPTEVAATDPPDTPSSPAAGSTTHHGRGRARPRHLLVILIGGINSDPTPAQIEGTAERREGNSGMYRLAGDFEDERVVAEYFNWNGTRAGKINDKKPAGARGIAELVRRHVEEFPGDRVALVGNSWGGHTAFELAAALQDHQAPLAIDLAVFLDASSAARGRARPKALPINVARAVSYYTHNRFVWGKWEAGRRLENIDLGDPEQRFMTGGQPPYDAPIDFRAHVAAEWDETIHADIKRRLLDLLAQ
jgi:hypothetical protein